jgi:hypothetical protein
VPAPAGYDEDRGESPTERADRNMADILQELRVALPGVQVLFAFLLAVAFQPRFAEVTAFQERVYFATLLLSALASALLIAPSAYHRLNFARRDKAHIVQVGSRLTVAGLGALALAMTGALLLVSDFLFGAATAAACVAVAGLAFAVLWFGLPLHRRRKTDPPPRR